MQNIFKIQTGALSNLQKSNFKIPQNKTAPVYIQLYTDSYKNLQNKYKLENHIFPKS